jgi:hypothetical protein
VDWIGFWASCIGGSYIVTTTTPTHPLISKPGLMDNTRSKLRKMINENAPQGVRPIENPLLGQTFKKLLSKKKGFCPMPDKSIFKERTKCQFGRQEL